MNFTTATEIEVKSSGRDNETCQALLRSHDGKAVIRDPGSITLWALPDGSYLATDGVDCGETDEEEAEEMLASRGLSA